MKRRIAIAASILLLAAAGHAQTAGRAGAFARMGFGARGMGMGNAMTAVAGGPCGHRFGSPWKAS